MTVHINYKKSNLKKISSNLILFVDEKFNINGLKKQISSSEFSYIADLLKTSDLKKDLLVFEINSKKTIFLVSVKKDIKTSDIENLVAKFNGYLDYDKKRSNNNNTFFSSKIATVFRDEANANLPTSSTLGEKQSDFVGEVLFSPNQNLTFDYNYSLHSSLDEINLHQFKNIFRVNNFVNTFTFYEENNLIGKKSYFENDIRYIIDKNNSLSFKTRENKTDNLTEYYKLVYEYKNDCLTASIRYNKEYYSNSSIKPNEELFFNITLIPLGSTKTDSLLK